LERQHRLVHGEGIRRLDPGGQRLSLFRFQHNLFRSYLYNELSEAERVYLHEDVGRALEALYAEQADEIAVQLALHFERAGVDEKARHYLQKAGEQAAERYANEEAIEYFTRALALTPKDDVYKHYDLLMQRVEMYSSKGDREAQQKDLDRLSELFLNEEAYQEEKAEILIKKSAYYEQYSMYAEALIELKKAMTIAKQLNISSLVARVQKAIGYVLWRKGTFKEAKIESEKAHALAQELGLGKIEAQALYDLAVIHWRLGNKDLSKKMAEQVMEKFLKLGNRKGEALAHSVLGNLALSSGHYEQAKDHYQKLLEIDLSIGNVRGQGMAQGNLGIIAEVEGDHSLAVNIFKDVRDVFHRIEDKGSEARAWAHIGLDYALQGAYDQAKENYKKAIEIYREINNRQGLQWVLSMVAWACYDTGLYNEAHLYCLESLDLAQEAGSRSAMDMVNWLIGRIFLAQGDFDQAEDAFYRSASYDDQVANSEEYARMRFASLADLAMARGNQQEAFEIVVEMIKDGFDFPYEVDNKNRVEILLTCYRVFNANQDPRGEEALEKAYQLIIEQAEKISDESMRKSYFENVQANREVLQSYHERV